MKWERFTPSRALYARGWVAGLRCCPDTPLAKTQRLIALATFQGANPQVPMWVRNGRGRNINVLFPTWDDAALFRLKFP